MRWISVVREIIMRAKRLFLLCTPLPACFAANLNTIRILDFSRIIGSQLFQVLFDIGVCPLKTNIKLPGVFV